MRMKFATITCFPSHKVVETSADMPVYPTPALTILSEPS